MSLNTTSSFSSGTQTVDSKIKCVPVSRSRILSDIAELQRMYPALKAHADHSIIYLNGTLPMRQGSAIYNIPLQIIVPETYPFVQPKVYVRPTENMVLAPAHRHVDSAGKVYHPSLSEWNPKTSSLLQLGIDLSATFAEASPVYNNTSRRSPLPHTPSPSFPSPQPRSSITEFPTHNPIAAAIPPRRQSTQSTRQPLRRSLSVPAFARSQDSVSRTPSPVKPRCSYQKRLPAARKPAAADSPQPIAEDKLCVICMEASKCVCLVPCGHICACEACAVPLDSCPTCRAVIQQKIRAFF